MGYGFVNIGNDRKKGDTPSYTYDASGHITAVDFGNGVALAMSTTTSWAEDGAVTLSLGGQDVLRVRIEAGNLLLEPLWTTPAGGHGVLGSDSHKWTLR